jgi:hypothetical protein
MNLTYEIRTGVPVKGRWGEWSRHDKVVVDGKEIEGSIQVRRRYFGRIHGRPHHRIETTTGFRGYCVMGGDPLWLIRQNLSHPMGGPCPQVS